MFSKTYYCAMCDRQLPKEAFKTGETIPGRWRPYLMGFPWVMRYSVCINCLTTKV